MKKIYLLLLFISTAAFAQPDIAGPATVQSCEVSGMASFDLTSQNTYFLNGLNPSLFTIEYYMSLEDAENNFFPVTDPQTFIASEDMQVLGVRVWENVNPGNYATSTLTLDVLPATTATISGDMVVCPGTLITPEITITGSGGFAPYTITYSINGGVNQTITTGPGGSASISVPPAVGAWTYNLVSVTSSGVPGCSQELSGSATVIILDELAAIIDGPSQICGNSSADIIFTGSNGTAPYIFTYGINGVQAGTVVSNNNGVAVLETPILTEGGVYHLMSITDSNGCSNPVFGEVQINVSPLPVVGDVTSMIVYDDPYDGFATFNIDSQIPAYTAGQPNLTVTFHYDQFSAEAGVNQILSPFVNTNQNYQQIFAAITDNATGCRVVRPLMLIVSPPPTDFINFPDAAFKSILVNSSASNQNVMDANGNYIALDANSDGEIQISEAQLAYSVIAPPATVSSVEGIKFFYNLRDLTCTGNQIGLLDLRGMPSLENVLANNNPMTALELDGNTNLQVLNIQENSLTSVDVSNCTALQSLSCSMNQLTVLNISNAVNLSSIDCSANNLVALAFNNTPSITQINCSNNEIVAIDLSTLTQLVELFAGTNQLTTIDVSENGQLVSLSIPNNPVETIFMKNGSLQTLDIAGINEINYICCDANEIESVMSNIDYIPSILVTTYCSEDPGGDYNVLTGTVKFDGNGNGCDALDIAQPFNKVLISNGISEGFVWINSELNYVSFAPAGTFTITPDLENSSIFTVNPPSATVTFADNANNVSVNNFCISANGIHPDVEIVVAPLMPARPGFDAMYSIVYRNKGNQVNAGIVTFNYNDSVTDLVSVFPAASTISSGTLTFAYSGLQPFEVREIFVMVNVNGPMETPAVNIGDLLVSSANITINGTDDMPSDNDYILNQTVVGSYDPNDKQCLEGNIVSSSQIGDYLHYLIRFENTGTYPAQNIVVQDVIDQTMFDVSTLQVLTSSHEVNARLSGNNAEFIFKNINLAIGGHGNILLKIKTLGTLTEGATVSNKADIFFDYNYPIVTNTASTLFQTMAVGENDLTGFSMYPNPAGDLLNIVGQEAIDEIRLYDFTGRLLQIRANQSNNGTLDLSARQAGIYFVTVSSAGKQQTVKIVKQ